MLRILGRIRSINVRKVLWTADELGLNYQHEPWGELDLPLASAQFRQWNPNGLVPVLLDEDFVLWESHAICRYLTRQFDSSARLYPRDVQHAGRVDQWLDWQQTELNGAWRYAYMHLIRQHPDYPTGPAVAASVAAWNQNMQILDSALASLDQGIVGDRFSLADIALGLSVHRWLESPIERPFLQHVHRYYQQLLLRPCAHRYLSAATP